MTRKLEEITIVYISEKVRRDQWTVSVVRLAERKHLPAGDELFTDEPEPNSFSSELPGGAVNGIPHRFSIVGDSEPDEFKSGLSYRLYGHWDRSNKKFGPQFKYKTFTRCQPHGRQGIIRYLCECRHIGRVTAEKLWEKFGGDAVRILRESPDVAAVAIGPRFSDDAAREAAEDLERLKALEDVTIELTDLIDGRGFPKGMIREAIRMWGNRACEILRRDPFKAQAFRGIGFKKADAFYLDLGHDPAKLKRQAYCLAYEVLQQSNQAGHVWIPVQQVVQQLKATIGGTQCTPEKALTLATRGRILKLRQDDNGEWWAADARRADAEDYCCRKIVQAFYESTHGSLVTDWEARQVLTERRPDFTRCTRCHRKLTADTVAILDSMPYGPDCIQKVDFSDRAVRMPLEDWLGNKVIRELRTEWSPAGETRIVSEVRWPSLDHPAFRSLSEHQREELGKALAGPLGILGGTPGCLHGDTPIYDPVDNTTLPVSAREQLRKPFFVFALNEDRKVVIAIACPPIRFSIARMFRFEFVSGRTITVTPAHRFWNGLFFESASSVSDRWRKFDVCHLPTIAEHDLLTQLHSTLVTAEYTKWDQIKKVSAAGESHYYDFHVPTYENYYAGGFFHHNSGKTFSCARLIEAIIDCYGSESIACMAPTGKASVRSREALAAHGITEIEPKTIHRTLGVETTDGSAGWTFKHKEGFPLLQRFLIVDESSMIGSGLVRSILAARARGTGILFVGDVEQLPPVEYGAPLRDMIAAGLPYGELTEIHRNCGSIVRACKAIREGRSFEVDEQIDLQAESPKNLTLVPAAKSIAPLKVISLLKMIRDESPFDAVWDTQVLVAVNKRSPLSRDALNIAIQEELNSGGAVLPGSPFRVGDKVIQTRNGFLPRATREQRPAGGNGDDKVLVCNGEFGRVLEVHEKKIIVRFDNPERVVIVPRSAGKNGKSGGKDEGGAGGGNGSDSSTEESTTGCDLELGYAVTIWKMQGSSAPVIIAGIDEYSGATGKYGNCDRAAIYTTLSRAEKLCILVGRKEVAEQVCRRQFIGRRVTFMQDLLTEYSLQAGVQFRHAADIW